MNGCYTFAPGEMAEWSIAAVLKTVDCHRSGGSNPSLSAMDGDKERQSEAKAFKFMNLKAFFVQLSKDRKKSTQDKVCAPNCTPKRQE